MSVKDEIIKTQANSLSSEIYYWGMDVNTYPGDTNMQEIWSNSPFFYTGFYLAPAPNHSKTSWMNARSTLKNIGWGFLPIYFGQNVGYSKATFTSAQGIADGKDAVNLALSAGFPVESYIYLDFETGGTLTTSQLTYITSWINQMNNVGSFWAGVYCSYSSTASQIQTAIASQANSAKTRFWCWDLSTSWASNSSTGTSSVSAPNPNVANNSTLQLAQNVTRTYGTYTFSGTNSVDIDTSTFQDPSV